MLSIIFCAFGQDLRGNVAVTFALSASALMISIGGAVDFSRSMTIGAELQHAIDSGVLAAASLSQDRPAEEVVTAYVAAGIGDHDGAYQNLEVSVQSSSFFDRREIAVDASIQIDTIFLGIVGINALTISRSAEAIEQSKNIEVAMVLDISSSIGGARIDQLRSATLEFLDAVAFGDPTTSVSIIPYGGTVRLPGPFFNLILDADDFSPPSFDWTIPIPETAADWNGCVELDDNAVRSIPLAAHSFGVLPDFTVWNHDHNWCPPDPQVAALFNTRNETQLTALASSLDDDVLSDGTGTDIATGWGVRALDPAWRGALGGDADFTNRPTDYDDEDTIKALIIMTDGGTTAQLRPESDWEPGSDGPHVGVGGTDRLYSPWQARQNFDQLCTTALSNGIWVYTIAFQVRQQWQRIELEECAGVPSRYFEIEDLNISSAFSSIAVDLDRLRISR